MHQDIYIYKFSVCVYECVCLLRIGGQTAGPIMTKFDTHMWIDLGMVPTFKKLTSHPRGVAVGILGGQKIKVREMSRTAKKSNNKINPHPTGAGGGGSFMGKILKCLGHFMNCRENRSFFDPMGGVRGENSEGGREGRKEQRMGMEEERGRRPSEAG